MYICNIYLFVIIIMLCFMCFYIQLFGIYCLCRLCYMFIYGTKVMLCFKWYILLYYIGIMSEKGLTPSQIESFFNSVDSEDDLDFSADDESDYYPNKEDFETSDDEVLENQVELPTDLNVPSKDVNDVATSSKKDLRRNLLWRQRSLILNENQLQLLTSTALPPELMELSQPIQFFSYLFPKKVFENISNETNLYIHQKEPNANITFTPLDIQQFVGIVLYMSISRLPKCALYWSASIGIPTIQNIMSQKTFETIRRHIHFNNNDNNLPLTDSRHDRLFKIRPLIQEINNNFGKVPKEQFLCVDEQICSTKARSHMKRYNPNKPHKWGYKIYVLSCNSGFCYKFEIDSGNENVVLLNEPDLGAASNCVVRLAREVPRHQNFRLYFDNYFNSLPLLNKAKKEYIQIDRPFAVAQYNSYMGGVDLIDSIIGRYKILLRSKRWQVRIFYHLLDLTISNAWLLYKRVMKANGYPGKVLSSSDFRLDIAEVLTKVNTKSKLGKRSSVIENELQLKKQRGPTQHVPNQMVRQDQVGHWPIWADKRIRCKFPNCAGYSQVMCNKLNSNLSAL
ncbi:piggyBac transposable element-derived protein 1-like isoform X2 [Drosophila ananassae]|uniref:piggyBac transposable element-derived protein 1-like isoform X2 n=1 Tax=Drosophila ananassae TaxID=7217 RepID=UPI001CFF7063|nr:piggyBac transposable element-derived protein 1-like isoform X2 [Drosophila ananassae]